MHAVNMRVPDKDKFGKGILAENQPEYSPIPALFRLGDSNGAVITEWELTPEERTLLLNGGRLRMETWTYGYPFSPVQLEVVSKDDAFPLESVS